jgi:hypothetical protein
VGSASIDKGLMTAMITRKDFVKNCAAVVCATGVCCANRRLEAQSAAETSQLCDVKELNDTRNRADAARLRFARLVEVFEDTLPVQDRKRLLRTLGTKCSETYGPALIDRYKGNLKGLLEEGLRGWMAEAHYDDATGTIRIVDKSPHCSCPLVKEGETPPSFCDCTLGWQEATYSKILGRPVKAELEESILRGDKRCVFRIQVI